MNDTKDDGNELLRNKQPDLLQGMPKEKLFVKVHDFLLGLCMQEQHMSNNFSSFPPRIKNTCNLF